MWRWFSARHGVPGLKPQGPRGPISRPVLPQGLPPLRGLFWALSQVDNTGSPMKGPETCGFRGGVSARSACLIRKEAYSWPRLPQCPLRSPACPECLQELISRQATCRRANDLEPGQHSPTLGTSLIHAAPATSQPASRSLPLRFSDDLACSAEPESAPSPGGSLPEPPSPLLLQTHKTPNHYVI